MIFDIALSENSQYRLPQAGGFYITLLPARYRRRY
jgi:hypothetical protein